MHLRFMAVIALVATAIFSGCVSSEVVHDGRKPQVIVDSLGNIFIHDRPVTLSSLGYQVRNAGFDPRETVNVLVPDPPDKLLMQKMITQLKHAGYTRVVFTTARKSFSRAEPNPQLPPAP